MNTNILTQGVRNSRLYRQLLCRFIELYDTNKPLPLLVEGVCEGLQYSLIYSLITDLKNHTGKPVLILTSEERKASKLNEFFKKCSLKSEFYSYRDYNFYNIIASHELEHERLKVLSGLALNSLDVVLTTPDAFLQYTMPKSTLLSKTLSINKDTPLDVSEFSEKLFSLGYTMAETVEGPGQYSVRGYIVDIFPTKCEYTVGKTVKTEQLPIRIELFGDEIDRMGTFDTITQRTIEEINSFTITPSKEIIPTAENLLSIKKEITKLLSSAKDLDTRAELEKELGALESNGACPFLDRFISLIYPQKESLLNYFDDDNAVIVCDTNGVKSKAKKSYDEAVETLAGHISNGFLPPSLANIVAPVSLIDGFIKEHQSIHINAFIVSHLEEEGGIYNFASKGVSFVNHSLDMIFEELKYFVDNKYRVVLVCQTEKEVIPNSLRVLTEFFTSVSV